MMTTMMMTMLLSTRAHCRSIFLTEPDRAFNVARVRVFAAPPRKNRREYEVQIAVRKMFLIFVRVHVFAGPPKPALEIKYNIALPVPSLSRLTCKHADTTKTKYNFAPLFVGAVSSLLH